MELEQVESLFKQGRAAYREKRLEDARQLFREALEACGAGDNRDCDRSLLAAIHIEIGRVERDLGRNETAVAQYRSAADIYRSLNDRLNLAHAIRHVADILRHMNRLQDADPYIQEAIRLYRSEQPLPPLHLANSLRVAALVREQAGNHAEALPLWVEARDFYRQAGVDAGVAESRAHLASTGAT